MKGTARMVLVTWHERLLVLAAAVLLSAACQSARRGEPLTGAQLQLNDRLQRGQTAFMRHCHQCHPNGEGGLGPSLNDKPLPGFLVRTQVRLGAGAMPALDRQEIPPDELKELVAYMKALRRSPGPRD
jgi:mono/diheme cytochrome c family protein